MAEQEKPSQPSEKPAEPKPSEKPAEPANQFFRGGREPTERKVLQDELQKKK